MASSSSNSVITVVLLLLSIVLAVSAFTDPKSVVPSVSTSLEVGSLTDTSSICDQKDLFKEVWGPTQDCSLCTSFCGRVCIGTDSKPVKKACALLPPSNKFCQCCCVKPPPSPPPPTPPCGQPGDISTETTIITSNCADCTNWCKEECSDVGGYVIDDKCEIGESKFARRCKCCCRENPPPPTCPSTCTVPGLSSCKYKLVSSLPLPASSSFISM